VGYFPERYGEGVIPLALDLLAGRPVSPATFVRHEMITSSNLRAFYGSDIGHWDVPDLTEVLSDTWSLVERGALTEANFRDLVFTHPYNFFAGKNPEFFKGTQVEAKLAKRKAA